MPTYAEKTSQRRTQRRRGVGKTQDSTSVNDGVLLLWAPARHCAPLPGLYPKLLTMPSTPTPHAHLLPHSPGLGVSRASFVWGAAGNSGGGEISQRQRKPGSGCKPGGRRPQPAAATAMERLLCAPGSSRTGSAVASCRANAHRMRSWDKEEGQGGLGQWTRTGN